MPEEAFSPDGLTRVIAQLATFLGSAGSSNGDRAMLKRMQFNQPPPMGFYKLALTRLPPGWDSGSTQRNWMVIVTGMCLMYPNIHRPNQPLGLELAHARYSEARLERVLASSGDTRRSLVLKMVRYLAARHVACDWTEVAGLLLIRDSDKLEGLQRRIARHYYSNLSE